MLRHIAKNLVANGYAKKCEIQISYAIGVEEPISIHINTFGTGTKSEEELIKIIKEKFNLTPRGIIEYLNLKNPIYTKTSGKVELEGENINNLTPDEIANKGVFMSFQLPEEIPGISTMNFLKYAKNKVTDKPVKIFEFKEIVKKYVEELNMNPKLIERNLNVGFSGGEKKKNEIMQMLVLNPKLAILDETDSGLDVDAIRTVSKGIEMYKNDENAVLIITHNTKILNHLKVDYVHVLVNGQIVKTSTAELAEEIEEKGYSEYKK